MNEPVSLLEAASGPKPFVERHWITLTLSLLDGIGALGIAGIVYDTLLTSLPVRNHVFGTWLLAFTLTWLSTFDIDKNFRLNAYATYIRVCKVACWSALGYLLFFVFTRFFYSLTFLFWITAFWMLWAIAARWLLRRLLPAPQGLALEALPTALANNIRLRCTTAQPGHTNNVAAFDFLVINCDKSYDTEAQHLFLRALTAGVPIFSVPQLTECLMGKIATESLYDFWTKTALQVNLFYLRCKRLLDVLIILALSPILIPLAAIIALLIRITMGKPVFFWQERIGLDSKPFHMVKFRTMVQNADQLGATYTVHGDKRITPLGKWLRRLRLDELPQLYNVLKGDMSLIGPRPEEATLVENFTKDIPLYHIRHWLRPGITGWAQVMQGYAIGERETVEKLQYDMFYLKNISFWLDLIILYRTAVIMLTGFGSR